MILGLCDRFHVLPSQVLEEDASVLKMIALERRAFPDRYEQPASSYGFE